jgi:hypothetical protein
MTCKIVPITIELDKELLNQIKKRAKKNYLTVKEQVEDIIRRSMINYKKGKNVFSDNSDDKLVSLFSRQRKGRKRK